MRLTRKYRAVLRHCAMALIAITCVVNNANADDITAYTNATSCDPGCYSGNGTDAVFISTDSSLGQSLTSSANVFGQFTFGNSNNAKVTMVSGEIRNLYGGFSSNAGTVSGNTVNILGGEVSSVYGGYSINGTVSNNVVLISGNPNVHATISVANERYAQAKIAENNILAISGTPSFNSTTNLYGGVATTTSLNNTLILNTNLSNINEVMFFQNYVFVVTNNVSNGDTMLSVANAVDLDGTKVAVGAISGSTLNVGDHVVLINNVTGTPTLDMSLFNDTNISKYAYTISTNYTFSIKVENNQLIATLDEILSDEEPEVVIDKNVVNGFFSGIKSAINNTTQAVKSSIKTRLDQLTIATPSNIELIQTKGSNGGDEDAKYGLWAQALYNHVKRDSSASAVGFKGHSEGVVMGADTEVTDGVIAGVAYSYTKSEMKSVGEKTDVKTHGFFAYGQYKPNEYFVNGSLGFGISKAEPKNGNDDVKSKFYSFDALTGFEKATDAGVFVPGVGVRYVRIDQDAYNDGDTRLKAKDSNTVTAVVQLGWNNAYKVNTMEITPRATLGFIYDIKSDDNKVNVKAGNVHILTEDDRLSRFGTELNVGVDTKVNNQWGLSLDYNGEYRQHYKNHTGTISVRYDF